jgi:hypothetical protein
VENLPLRILSERRLRRTLSWSSGQEATGSQGRKALRIRGLLSRGRRWQLSAHPLRAACSRLRPNASRLIRDGSDAVPPDRPGTWPEWVMAKEQFRRLPQAQNGKGTRSRPSNCARRRTSKASVFDRAQQRRSESRMPARAPVTDLPQGRPRGKAARGETSGARHTRAQGKRKVRPRLARHGCPHAGESGVGSNAGPICFARLRVGTSPRKPLPLSPRVAPLQRPRG